MATASAHPRQAVGAAVMCLDSLSHNKLTALAPSLGLPMPPEVQGVNKIQRLAACLAAIRDDQLLAVARNLLRAGLGEVGLAELFALEDAVWSTEPVVGITAKIRRDVADAINLYDLARHRDRFERLLNQFWVLDDDPMEGWVSRSVNSRRGRLQQWVFDNRDWSTRDLFDDLGAFDAPPARFERFLAALVDPSSLPDEAAQLRVVEAVNGVLTGAGGRLDQVGEKDGYPYFHLVSTGPNAGRRPKTLIFASMEKPDIRLVSVVDNDVEVLQGSDKLLVYDRIVGRDGLRWKDLLVWWSEITGAKDEKTAAQALHRRLLASMPTDERSPQRQVYRSFQAIFEPQGQNHPALLPEVWLHWDHQTVKQRGVHALLNHRMDYLLLMPHGHRIVIEIDGPRHYATDQAYADTVRGDRELKLRGYDVYRLSYTELHPRKLAQVVTQFFAQLFDHYDAGSPSSRPLGQG
ncbi:hypothetical protein ABUW04_31885 [Streptacidiphilus sp. N1-10]|uniref:AbiJ-NTD3 domain-containing protein n=1 Tax=Streptacidiphilus jeojiensis TaxID=3229225 RepID=A0ABV6XX60_9ACTN